MYKLNSDKLIDSAVTTDVGSLFHIVVFMSSLVAGCINLKEWLWLRLQ